MNFHAGQKVVCIIAGPTEWSGAVELIKGKIYTVRWAGLFDHPLFGQYYGVSIVGFIRAEQHPVWTHLNDVPFDGRRFRPVVEKKTDIAAFTEILNRENSKVPA